MYFFGGMIAYHSGICSYANSSRASRRGAHPLPEGEICVRVKVYNFHLDYRRKVVEVCAALFAAVIITFV